MTERTWIGVVVALLLGLVAPAAAWAEDIIPDTDAARQAFLAAVNGHRVGIVTGGPGGTYIRLGSDLSNLVEQATGDAVRVIVMEGRGSVGNLQDLAFLYYVDLALVQADVLNSIAVSDPDDYDYLHQRLAFVAQFHPEIIHVLARGGPFDGPAALDGKRVAIDLPGSGTQITAPIVFGIAGARPDFVAMRPADALADLTSESPSIDAMVYVAGRGSSLFKTISPDLARRIREAAVYFVPFPAAPPADSAYLAASVSAADYPSLVAAGGDVPVWAVPAVLAVYDWNPHGNSASRDRYQRLADFVDAFFDNRSRLDDGPGGYDDNWCTIDLGRAVPGWKRFGAAAQWLAARPGASTAICGGEDACRTAFAQAMQRAGLDAALPEVAALYPNWRAENAEACS